MASARDIQAGGAYVRLFTQDSDMVKGLRKAEKNFHDWAGKINRAGTSLLAGAFAVGAPLGAAVKIYSDAGSALNDLAGRTGASTDALQKLSFAANQTGSDAEALEAGIKKLGKNIGEALGGDKAAKELFAEIGLSAQKFAALPLDKQFEVIAERLSRIPEGALRTKATLDLLGKSGTALLPMLMGGGAELAAYGKRLEELGVVKTPKAISAADDLGDKIDEVGLVIQHTAFVIGDALAPSAMQLADRVIEVVKATNEWIDANPGVVTSVAMVAAGAGAAGVALLALGTATHVVGWGLGAMGTAAVAVTSPLGLIAVAAGGIGYAVATQTEIGGAALEELKHTAAEVGGDITTTWHGITDAVAGDDLVLAGQVAMAGLNVAWATGAREIGDIWTVTSTAIVSQWTDSVAGIEMIGAHLEPALKTVWADIRGTIDLALTSIAQVVTRTLEEIVGRKYDLEIMLGIGTEGEKALALEPFKNGRQQNEQDYQSRAKGRDADRLAAGGQLGDSLKGIELDRQQQHTETERAQTDALNASEAKLTKAREDLAKVRDKAAQAKAEADAKRDGKPKPKPKPGTEAAYPKLAKENHHSEQRTEATTSGLAASLNRSFGKSGPIVEMDRFGEHTDETTGKIREQTAALNDRNRAAIAPQQNPANFVGPQHDAPASGQAKPATTREEQLAALRQLNRDRKAAAESRKAEESQKKLDALNERRKKRGLKPLDEAPTIELPPPNPEGVRPAEQPLPAPITAEATSDQVAISDEKVMESLRKRGQTEEQIGDMTAKEFESERARLEREHKLAPVFKPLLQHEAQASGEPSPPRVPTQLDKEQAALKWAEEQKLKPPETGADVDRIVAQFEQSATFKRQQPQPVKPEATKSKPAGPQPGQHPEKQAIAWAEQQGLPLPTTGEETDALLAKFKQSATAKKLNPQVPQLPTAPALSDRAKESMAKAGIKVPTTAAPASIPATNEEAAPVAAEASPLTPRPSSLDAVDSGLTSFAERLASLDLKLPPIDFETMFANVRMPEVDPAPPPQVEQSINQSVSAGDNQKLDDVLTQLKIMNSKLTALNAMSS